MEVTAAEARIFVERALDQMLAKARLLGDDVATTPEVGGGNSVFALVTHCVGLTDFWLDHVVLGHPTDRDRASEFVATGGVDDLEPLVAGLKQRLPDLLAAVTATPEPAGTAAGLDPEWPLTVGAIVLHVVEELFQHAGHVDLTADLLRQGRDAT